VQWVARGNVGVLRKIRVALFVMTVAFALSFSYTAQTQSTQSMAGRVMSTEEGPMKGVLVSARKAGSTARSFWAPRWTQLFSPMAPVPSYRGPTTRVPDTTLGSETPASGPLMPPMLPTLLSSATNNDGLYGFPAGIPRHCPRCLDIAMPGHCLDIFPKDVLVSTRYRPRESGANPELPRSGKQERTP
jgi:hypothetical protein